MIQARNVHYRYGQIPALNGVSFDIAAGCFTGIIGPNGSGKSTLLSVLAGILRPQSGEVSLQERPLSSWSIKERARVISLVPQENYFPFDFTALEVVLMGRSPYLGPLEHEKAYDLEIARQAMEICDCWHLRGRSIRELSGGERQRAILARALAQEPKILLLDEPTNHLDLSHQSKIMEYILDLCHHGRLGVAAVFHDLNLASRFCDKLLLLDRGRVVCQGTSSQVMIPEVMEKVYGCKLNFQLDPQGKVFVTLI